MSAPHMTTLQEHLLQTLSSLRSREFPMEPDRARAVAQVAGVLVDSARVEVEYLKVSKQDVSNFIDGLKAPQAIAAIEQAPSIETSSAIDRSTPGILRHRMQG